eukprot:PLAT13698.1.p1 GENE.PLAT13698.1~~PLAT13698.1.p1  ORF type:complete len:824 (-),score=325.08 PLAT13698.1:1429-3900(-)
MSAIRSTSLSAAVQPGERVKFHRLLLSVHSTVGASSMPWLLSGCKQVWTAHTLSILRSRLASPFNSAMADADSWKLSCELIGHGSTVRCATTACDGTLLSGSRDRFVKQWSKVDDGSVDGPASIWVEKSTNTDHPHWVNAVLAFDASVLDVAPAGGYVTACQDNCIRVYDMENNPLGLLSGHDSHVSSLAWAADGRLLSGSWDGTARVWDLSTGKCEEVLEGHENSVCVLGLPNGDIVTGSTGKQSGSTIVDFQIRIWRDGRCVKSLREHSGAVRALVAVGDIGFASASNDGTARVWTMEGDCISVMPHEVLFEGKDCFVYSLAHLSDGLYATGADDGCLRIWRGDKMLAALQHPDAVWAVAMLPNGDVATGCGDGFVRVWTCAEERFASEAVLIEYDDRVKAALASSGGSNVDVSSLPGVDEQLSTPGVSEGQVKLFRKGDKAFAYQWSAASSSWLEIGEVTGSAGGKDMADGKEWDVVLPVELETHAGLLKVKLGFNHGENPYDVAKRFIQRHKLDPGTMGQIADFVKQNSGAGGAPMITSAAPVAPPAKRYTRFPKEWYTTFEKIKLPAVLGKLLAFGEELGSMSEADVAAVKDVVDVLGETSRWHASKLKSVDLRLLVNLLRWPVAKTFPVLDLLRIAVLHPSGASHFAGATGQALFDEALRLATAEDAPLPVQLLGLRLLCNLFIKTTTRTLVAARLSDLLDGAADFSGHDNMKLRATLACLYANASLLTTTFAGEAKEEAKSQLLMLVLDLLGLENDAATTSWACIALGTLVWEDSDAASTARDLDIAPVLAGVLERHADSESIVVDVGEIREAAGL